MNAGMTTAGVFAGVDYYGETKPAGILVWGANPAISGADGELQWHIKDAVSRGTPLIVVAAAHGTCEGGAVLASR